MKLRVLSLGLGVAALSALGWIQTSRAQVRLAPPVAPPVTPSSALEDKVSLLEEKVALLEHQVKALKQSRVVSITPGLLPPSPSRVTPWSPQLPKGAKPFLFNGKTVYLIPVESKNGMLTEAPSVPQASVVPEAKK